MSRQFFAPVGVLALAVAVVALMPLTAAGQDTNQGSEYEPARTPWGDPDLRGHYLPGRGGAL